MPSRLASSVQRAEVNTEPLSEVMFSGRPNLDIHASMSAETQEAVDASAIGTASGHLVDLSIVVKMYLHPSDVGRGPTTSTWM